MTGVQTCALPILIFSRIREEIIAGKAIPAATRIGSKRAMTTVIDSQVTTLIAAVVLYQMGTSSVKGFAWTLMIGIIVSIFTAVVVTNFYLGLLSTNSKFAKPGNFGIRADGTTTFNLKNRAPQAAHRGPAARHRGAARPRHHRRSEERRVGKECRSRWSPYH